MGPQRRTLGTLVVALTATVTVLALGAAAAVQAWSGIAYNCAWTVGALCALAGTLTARANAEPAARARWTWWAAASACWAAGQIAWDVFSVTGVPPSPNLADAGWWGFAILVMAGLLAPAGSSRALRLLEALPLTAAVMALTWAELWDEAAASQARPAEVMAVLGYPALYVSAAVLVLQAMVGRSLPGVRGPGSRLVLVGMIAQAVAFILWTPSLLAGTYMAGEGLLIDPLWALGLVAIGAGGALTAHAPPAAEPADAEPGGWSGVLPATVFMLLIAAVVRSELGDEPLPVHLLLAGGLLVCGALLIGRGMLLARRMRGLLERERAARDQLAGREVELARLNRRLVEDSRRDPLTGLLNRRALEADLAADRGERAVALLDVDRFKSFNDRLGHLAGDQALRTLAATVRDALRAGDDAYRYGGEELLLVLPGAGTQAATAAAERVRAAVEAARLPHPDGDGGVLTVSIGVASGAGDPAALIARADAALYEAKAAGRNRVRGAGDDAPQRARRPSAVDEPVIRHLRGALSVARAGATGRGALAVAEALAQAIRSELRFEAVVVNLRETGTDDLRVALVAGDEGAHAALAGTSSPWAEWAPLLEPRHERCGASWLPAGSYEDWDTVPTFTPELPPSAAPDAWRAEDMLLLPLRATSGALLGVVSVDRPFSGRRPDDGEISVLMAVADHAALALEHVEHEELLLGAARHAPTEHRMAAVMLLAETLDLRDAGTSRHSQTVGGYARDVAAALGLPAERVERIHAAGVLHDLGKLGVPDAVLHKAGRLDDAEWREMRRHPDIGARILEHAGLPDIAAWVRAHHERIDGRGYPLGLAGDAIPLEARILAVADAYEAMIADRPYRSGRPAAEADAELLANAGTQFDARVVDAFLAAIGRRALPRTVTA